MGDVEASAYQIILVPLSHWSVTLIIDGNVLHHNYCNMKREKNIKYGTADIIKFSQRLINYGTADIIKFSQRLIN